MKSSLEMRVKRNLNFRIMTMVMSLTVNLMDIMNVNAIGTMIEKVTEMNGTAKELGIVIVIMSEIGTVIEIGIGNVIAIDGIMSMIVTMTGIGTVIGVEIVTGIMRGTGLMTEKKIVVVTIIMMGNGVKATVKGIMIVMCRV
jgi:hypothetical protein